MNDAPERLSRCFSSVFPKLSQDKIASASVETVEAWDSVAAATLMTVIEEEFGIEFQQDDALEHLASYQSILDYLNQIAGKSPTGSY
jgi:acyl carrier protein